MRSCGRRSARNCTRRECGGSSNLDEVVRLLDTALGEMDLSASPHWQMPKYRAMYYGEGLRAPIRVALGQYQTQEQTGG